MTIVINRPSPHRRGLRPSTGLAVGLSTVAIAWACISGPTDDGHDEIRLALLKSEVDDVLAPTYASFAERAASLRDATKALADARAAGDDDAMALASARQAWIDASLVWQRAEVMQIGPAGSSAYVIGGQDRRDAVFGWPTVSACRVDVQTAGQGYAAADFLANALVDVRGLATVEYLLFVDGSGNACGSSEPINADGTWAALAEEDIATRRAAYAAVVAADVASIADELAQTWVPGTGEFARWLVAPAENGSPYESPAAGLDDVLGALGYVDTVLKDGKLASDDAASGDSPWAQQGKEHALANLEGARMLILGGESAEAGTGFDDFLVELGASDLADRLDAAVDEAVGSVAAVDGSFEAALAADPMALVPAQAAVQRLVDLLKGEVATTLGLRAPGEAAGDAD